MLIAIIWDRISLRKCAVYQQKWLEGHIALLPKSQFWGQCIHTAISPFFFWEMHHCKKPPDQHLNCAIQISLYDANLRTHGPKYRHSNDGNSNDHSNCTLCSCVKTLWKRGQLVIWTATRFNSLSEHSHSCTKHLFVWCFMAIWWKLQMKMSYSNDVWWNHGQTIVLYEIPFPPMWTSTPYHIHNLRGGLARPLGQSERKPPVTQMFRSREQKGQCPILTL